MRADLRDRAEVPGAVKHAVPDLQIRLFRLAGFLLGLPLPVLMDGEKRFRGGQVGQNIIGVLIALSISGFLELLDVLGLFGGEERILLFVLHTGNIPTLVRRCADLPVVVRQPTAHVQVLDRRVVGHGCRQALVVAAVEFALLDFFDHVQLVLHIRIADFNAPCETVAIAVLPDAVEAAFHGQPDRRDLSVKVTHRIIHNFVFALHAFPPVLV